MHRNGRVKVENLHLRQLVAGLTLLVAACAGTAAPVSGYQSIVPLVELEDAVLEEPVTIETWSEQRAASDPADVDPGLPSAELKFVGSVESVDMWAHIRGDTAIGLFANAEDAALYHPADLNNPERVLELVLGGRCEGDMPTSGFASMVAGSEDVVGISVLDLDGWRFIAFRDGVAVLPVTGTAERVAVHYADGSIQQQDLFDPSLC